MSNIEDIFDISTIKAEVENEAKMDEEPKPETVKKPRKKAELSDDKKIAMLERLKAGREKRAENLQKKKEAKEPQKVEEPKVVEKQEQPKEPKKIAQPKEPKEPKVSPNAEAEKLSFINMMAGKMRESNPDKYVRPKKKVYEEPKKVEEPKVVEEVKKVEQPKAEPVSKPIVNLPPKMTVKQPVIIRTFKKPIWAQ